MLAHWARVSSRSVLARADLDPMRISAMVFVVSCGGVAMQRVRFGSLCGSALAIVAACGGTAQTSSVDDAGSRGGAGGSAGVTDGGPDAGGSGGGMAGMGGGGGSGGGVAGAGGVGGSAGSAGACSDSCFGAGQQICMSDRMYGCVQDRNGCRNWSAGDPCPMGQGCNNAATKCVNAGATCNGDSADCTCSCGCLGGSCKACTGGIPVQCTTDSDCGAVCNGFRCRGSKCVKVY